MKTVRHQMIGVEMVTEVIVLSNGKTRNYYGNGNVMFPFWIWFDIILMVLGIAGFIVGLGVEAFYDKGVPYQVDSFPALVACFISLGVGVVGFIIFTIHAENQG